MAEAARSETDREGRGEGGTYTKTGPQGGKTLMPEKNGDKEEGFIGTRTPHPPTETNEAGVRTVFGTKDRWKQESVRKEKDRQRFGEGDRREPGPDQEKSQRN